MMLGDWKDKVFHIAHNARYFQLPCKPKLYDSKTPGLVRVDSNLLLMLKLALGMYYPICRLMNGAILPNDYVG